MLGSGHPGSTPSLLARPSLPHLLLSIPISILAGRGQSYVPPKYIIPPLDLKEQHLDLKESLPPCHRRIWDGTWERGDRERGIEPYLTRTVVTIVLVHLGGKTTVYAWPSLGRPLPPRRTTTKATLLSSKARPQQEPLPPSSYLPSGGGHVVFAWWSRYWCMPEREKE